jgi:hypothetical protein
MFWGGESYDTFDPDECSASARACIETTYCRHKRPVGHARGGLRLGSPATGRSLVRSPRLDRGTQRKSGSNRAAPRAPRLPNPGFRVRAYGERTSCAGGLLYLLALGGVRVRGVRPGPPAVGDGPERTGGCHGSAW